MSERVLITGITGQDGSYLAEHLLGNGCEVAGLVRSSSTGNLGNAEHLKHDIHIFKGSLDDETSIETMISEFRPHKIYNLGAEAAPFDSFQRPVYTSDINALGPLRIFEAALRLYRKGHDIRIYQASTSEMYGAPTQVPQNENTPFNPNNPYGAAKLFAHNNARILREGADQLPIACGILFNHESPRRGMQYLTRKITVGVACIANKVKDPPVNELGKSLINKIGELELGNLDAQRDWGYAKDYIRAMPIMLRQEKVQDYVIATGETHSVREFAERAFAVVGLDYRNHVVVNPNLVRPLETGPLCGDPTKANRNLGWYPDVKFEELIKIMVEADLEKFH